MSVKQFPHLFEPLKVRGTTFKNRIFSAPQGYYNVGPEAHPNADMIAYFEAKAQGGIASVCIGDAIVHSPTGNKGSVPHLDDPSTRVHMAFLANAINRHGAVATVELNHAGMYSRAVVNEGKPLYGPSAMAATDYHPWEVEEMPEDVIIEIIESFGKSAAFVKSLGYGMVTIHGGHGWLVHQFMSERLNHRTDKWGGSLENRMRFPIAVADSIRRHAGPNFPIEFRMSGAEWAMADDGNGYDIDEGVRFAKALDGHVDILHVSAGTHENVASVCISHPSIFLEAGVNSKYAAEIKKHVNCLVATVGSFSDPKHMEEFIAAGHADIVEIARQSLADPQIATKARTGRADEVNQCIRCMQCYRTGTKLGSHYCSVNPMTSRERTVAMAPAVKQKKKVLVAGGGIAGMQAALTAAKRGHEVILCEKSDRLGGVLLCEENVPFKKFMHEYIERQKLLISRSAVDVRLNTEVTPEYAESLEPDAIIAAIGGRPIVPPIEGIDGANVLSCEEAYANPEKAGQNVVIIGAGLAGTELGIYYKKLGKNPLVVEMGDAINGDASLHTVALRTEIKNENLQFMFSTTVTKITDKGVIVKNADGETEIAVDTVVYATGTAPLSEEAHALYNCANEFFIVGDCLLPKNIMHATHTAFQAAYDIGTI